MSYSEARRLSSTEQIAPLDCIPLDFEQLAENTFGDVALRLEILKLFADQLAISRSSFEGQFSGHEWRFATHTLKGAASAVGACQFAHLAHDWEKQGPPTDQLEADKLLFAFDLAVVAFKAIVRDVEGVEL